MLASITPLGERGRHSHWPVTVSAFIAGATGSGALAGALAGGVGSLALNRLGLDARLAVLAVATLVAIALDAVTRVPGPRRQVDERWLHEFRGWVYGVGYGAQLGVGVATVVSSAATYVALVAALLVADPGRGAVVMGGYGLIRGLAVLGSAGVRRPDQLITLHAWLERRRATASIGGVALLTAIFAGAAIGAAL
jgi:hypothetical protein